MGSHPEHKQEKATVVLQRFPCAVHYNHIRKQQAIAGAHSDPETSMIVRGDEKNGRRAKRTLIKGAATERKTHSPPPTSHVTVGVCHSRRCGHQPEQKVGGLKYDVSCCRMWLRARARGKLSGRGAFLFPSAWRLTHYCGERGSP